jgi:hypothetical protein
MSESYVCTVCGFVGPAKTITPGSFLIELVAWIVFLIPGVIYSLWRISARKRVCSGCGSQGIVPATSPVGRRLIDSHSSKS